MVETNHEHSLLLHWLSATYSFSKLLVADYQHILFCLWWGWLDTTILLYDYWSMYQLWRDYLCKEQCPGWGLYLANVRDIFYPLHGGISDQGFMDFEGLRLKNSALNLILPSSNINTQMRRGYSNRCQTSYRVLLALICQLGFASLQQSYELSCCTCCSFMFKVHSLPSMAITWYALRYCWFYYMRLATT